VLILGINAYHGDSSACLIRDGRLVAAAEEERFRRIKHWAGFPSESIRYCLAEAGVDLTAVEQAAINSDPGANFWRKAWFAVTHRPDPRLILNRLANRRRRPLRSVGAASAAGDSADVAAFVTLDNSDSTEVDWACPRSSEIGTTLNPGTFIARESRSTVLWIFRCCLGPNSCRLIAGTSIECCVLFVTR